jgi:precorrin-4/cobalt-precorrin-4 C11-methyltransferase
MLHTIIIEKEKISMNNLSVSKLRSLFMILFFVFVISVCSGQNVDAKENPTTHFYLVSVGNGDPDNITLRAINTIKDSDIIFCDKRIRDKFPVLLAGKDIYDPGFGIFSIYGKTPAEARKNKRFKYKEKLKEFEQISSIIRKAVKEGKTVSVLDSGDPTLYGPNMWYMEAFEDLNPEIIPGISCFNAANAALKKGVTSGKKTHSVILTASFGREEYKGSDSIENLSANQATMVFFTMFLDFEEVVKKLRTHYPPDTPVAIVIYAGYKDKEKVIRGTLDTILEKTKGEKLPHEHLIYVGDFLTRRYQSGN